MALALGLMASADKADKPNFLLIVADVSATPTSALIAGK